MTSPVSPQPSAQSPLPGEDGYLTIHGLQHHYIRWGEPSGEPLVFLHGLMNNGRYWEHIARRLVPD